jgi:hypothetical protein
MPGNKSVVSREFRVTITVEEVEGPNLNDVPSASEKPLSNEAEEFVDESDYTLSR